MKDNPYRTAPPHSLPHDPKEVGWRETKDVLLGVIPEDSNGVGVREIVRDLLTDCC